MAVDLHPLTGNNGAGWPFGKLPQESDLYAVIANAQGVEYVADVAIDAVADPPDKTDDTLKTQRFLICSGAHRIRFV